MDGAADDGGWPSTVRQKVFLDPIAVGFEHDVGAAQLANLLFRALDHAVALARLRIEDLASGRHLEALFGARFGLDLGHLALLGRRRLRLAGRKCSSTSGACLEHIAAATAALNQPGDGRARLWQRPPEMANAGASVGQARRARTAENLPRRALRQFANQLRHFRLVPGAN